MENEEFLIRDFEYNWNKRLERLNWLEENVGSEISDEILLFGGELGTQLWKEGRQAFINSHFLAVEIIGLSFIDYQLSGFLRMAGNNEILDRSAYRTIEKAYEEDLISEGDKELFHKVRDSRNSKVHYQSPMNIKSMTHRVAEERTPVNDLLEQDAKTAIKAMSNVAQIMPIRQFSNLSMKPFRQSTILDFVESE